jgi:uncharacterized membrane protein YjfL (UPF0719 family)
MWKILGTIIEMFVYASVYMIITLVALKIVSATFSPDFDKKISEEGSIGYSLICAAVFIGLAMVLSSVLR